MRKRSLEELIDGFTDPGQPYAKETVRVRKAAIRDFKAWLEAEGLPWPCHPLAITVFLSTKVESRPGTLAGYAGAIRHQFIEEGHPGPNPAKHDLVRDFLSAHLRTQGRRPPPENQSRRLEIAEIEALCITAVESGTASDLQTRAHILTLFGCALRHSHTMHIDLADMRLLDDGVTMLARASKTDQEGSGQELDYPHTCADRPHRRATCCACAIVDHVEELIGTTWEIGRRPGHGPLFRRPNGQNLDGNLARRRLKSLAKRAGVDPVRLGTHSFKRTHISIRSEKGTSSLDISSSTRTSLKVLGSHYIDVNRPFPEGPS